MGNNIQKDVIILGGGITGLAIAQSLSKAGISYVILEAGSEIGGVIKTYSKDGFTYEAGPNTGVLSSPDLVSLFDRLDGSCELEIADSSAKRRLIWKKGKWHAIPSGIAGGVITPLFSLKDKFRILGEPFRPKGGDPHESVAGLVRRRMGSSFLDYAVDPFISGVYAGNPEKLITKYALPKLYNLEQDYGSFIGGAMKKARETKTALEKRATRDVFSVKGGLGRLVNALADSTGRDNIVTSFDNAVARQVDNRYIVSGSGDKVYMSRCLVTTFGSAAMGKTLPFIDDSLIDKINGLDYARVVQVAAGYKKWRGIRLNAFGGLVPSREQRNVLGILFPSSIFNNRAPGDGALLSVFLGGYRNGDIVEMDNEAIIKLVLAELKETMQTGAHEPDLLEIFRYKRAIPQYEISSGERFRAIAEIEKNHPGLFLAGNIRNGVGIADRVSQAAIIARDIAERIYE